MAHSSNDRVSCDGLDDERGRGAPARWYFVAVEARQVWEADLVAFGQHRDQSVERERRRFRQHSERAAVASPNCLISRAHKGEVRAVTPYLP